MTSDHPVLAAARIPVPERTLVRVGAICSMVAGTLRLATSFVDPDADGAVISATYDVIDIGLMVAVITAFVAIPESRTRLGTVGFAIGAIGCGLLIGPEPAEGSIDHYALGAAAVTIGFAALAVAWKHSAIVTASTRRAFLATLAVGAVSGLHHAAFVTAGLAFALGLLGLGRCLLAMPSPGGARTGRLDHQLHDLNGRTT
ncbi:MAG: hypothetical protein MUE78_02700 [Ilumatobacteraceae bacterium]|jgi:hypothetical protein|nr:hypothetical protein [Ilumatobacteraceae bacterium]